MFKITVALGSTQWMLLYKTGEAAASALGILKTTAPIAMVKSQTWIKDDFGQEIYFYPEALSGYLYEDLEQSKLAYCELILHQTRAQIAAAKMADSDMSIRAARMTQQGGAVLDPMMAFNPNHRRQ